MGKKTSSALRVDPGRWSGLCECPSKVELGDPLYCDNPEARLERGRKQLRKHQTRLYAGKRWSLLLILQGMDASGKDSAIRHMFRDISPNGVRVTNFGVPNEREVLQDFLWRAHRVAPEKGHIAVFNRSYYEEVTTVRVWPEYLARQHIDGPVDEAFWQQREASILTFEQHLARQQTVILKFWLQLSKAEQRERLLARLDRAEKQWKFHPSDITAREAWLRCLDMHSGVIARTSTPEAPWYVIPADDKPMARVLMLKVINARLRQLGLTFPAQDGDVEAWREALLRS